MWRWFRRLPPRVQAVVWIALIGLAIVANVTYEEPTDPASTPAPQAESRPPGASSGPLAGDLDGDGVADEDSAASSGGDGRRGALVTRVIDGDTIELGGVGRVRLIGVDTPERGEECYKEATDYLRGRVGGQTVRYRYQREREDRYGRQLLDIFRGDELVNLDIAQAGWGEELTISPNDRYSERILDAELNASTEPRGRWAGCAPEPEPEPEPVPEPDPPLPQDDDGGGNGGGGVPAGGCDSTSATDIPVPPGSPGDGDRDGIACES